MTKALKAREHRDTFKRLSRTFYCSAPSKKFLIKKKQLEVSQVKARIIHTKFFTSERVLSLSSKSRWLFMYFLTCSGIGHTGAFKWSNSVICFETGLSSSDLSKAKTELENAGLVFFLDQWVIVPDTEDKTGYDKGPTTSKAYKRELDSLPETIKDVLISKSIYPMDRVSQGMHTHINNKEEIIKQEGGVGETKKPDPVRAAAERLISVFNQEFNKKYVLTSKRSKLIAERLKTFPQDQLEQAVKKASQSPFHRGQNERGWEADPDYLFRSDEIVDKCLNLKSKTAARQYRSTKEVADENN